MVQNTAKGILLFLLGILFSLNGSATKGYQKGFKALAVYDYFNAKKHFYKSLKQAHIPYSAYGLAIIYARNDNPFSNSDSAVKYSCLSYNQYVKKPKKQLLNGFLIDSTAILSLVDSIAVYQLKRAKRENTVAALNDFLTRNYLANQQLIKQATYFRDELEFNQQLEINLSDSTRLFMNCHPQSSFYKEAQLLADRQIYDELTSSKTADSYTLFITNYPKNMMLSQAYEKLFSIYRAQSNSNGLALFVKNYPQAPQNLEAWKLLFSLTVKAYSFSELKHFLEDYPEFPLKNSILKELELNKLVLYPFQLGDFTGFINEDGKFAIEPLYDAVSEFQEGLSVVTKNDSVFYINKENVNPFASIYNDAMPFKNGIAPVKLNAKWFFINRQGQTSSKLYDEINELSNSVYVVKSDEKYGALDQYGQLLIEPKFDKLGDFKNENAYYVGEGAYGFVSINGTVHKPEYEWISDFDEQQIAIIRKGNKYGLINSLNNRVLEPLYDQIIKTNSGILIVVSNNNYGFFNVKGCFITNLIYDYSKDKTPEYYTNGSYFRLLKKKGQLIVDENGVTAINTEVYSEISFLKDGLMRVKKKKKYGYVNRKLNTDIAFKYEEADDFSDSLAMVKQKSRYLLINTKGKEIFSDAQPIKKLSPTLYEISREPKILINNKGQMLMNDVIEVGRLNKKLLIISRLNGEIKLINN
jgi:hypothetical protein